MTFDTWLTTEGFEKTDPTTWQCQVISNAGPVTLSLGHTKNGYLIALFGGGKGTVYLGRTKDEKAIKMLWNALYSFVRSQP